MSKKTLGKPLGRPKAFSEEQALDAAMHVFSVKGYEAASIADLTEAMGIKTASLYASFGNKEALFVKAHTRYITVSIERLGRCFQARTAKQAIDSVLRDCVIIFTESDDTGLCFITQAPLTNANVSKATIQFVAHARRNIELALKTRLDQAVSEGELASDVSTADLARYYAVTALGIALHAQHGGTRAELLRIVEIAMNGWPRRNARKVGKEIAAQPSIKRSKPHLSRSRKVTGT